MWRNLFLAAERKMAKRHNLRKKQKNKTPQPSKRNISKERDYDDAPNGGMSSGFAINVGATNRNGLGKAPGAGDSSVNVFFPMSVIMTNPAMFAEAHSSR